MKTIIRFFLSTVAVLVTGCTPEEEHIPAQGGDSFTLSSSEEQVITRAGDVSVNHFTAGTKYRLYGLIGSSWSGRLSTMNGQEGTEVVGADGTHQIEYLSTGTDEDRFEGRILDFYALTYGNTTLPICGSEADGIPVCNVTSSAGGVLPDLRRAVLTGQSGINSGVITLPFKHTLSKLKFEVVKQKPENCSAGVDVLAGIELKGITVSDYSEGALLLSTGEYSYMGGKSDRAVLGSGFSQAVTESVQFVTIDGQSGSAAAECLIFPTLTTAAEGLKIKVATKGTNSGDRTDTYEIRVPVIGDDGEVRKDENGKTVTEPFRFLPNYEYTLTITITNSDVQIITIIPRRYDWIEHNDDSQYMGQPLTFNGVMWMDRNLGATSADMTTPEGWEAGRGYYYQVGRDIPYFVKRTVNFKGSDGKTYTRPYCRGYSSGAAPYPVITGKEGVSAISGPQNPTNVAVTFDDVKEGKTVAWIVSKADATDWDNTHAISINRWKTPLNDPCPKGWRLPTYIEFAGIMPLEDKSGDITFLQHSGTSWIETMSNDPESGYTSVYIGERANTGTMYGVIYALKYQGTSRAYRIKWEPKFVSQEDVSDGSGVFIRRAYMQISKYSCTSADRLTLESKSGMDWEHPSDVINIPIYGFIWARSAMLINDAFEAMYLTSTTQGNMVRAAKLKFDADTSTRYLNMSNYTPADGFQIRCVRDVTSQ